MAVKRLLLIVSLVVVALLLALAWLRTKEAGAFSRPYRVHTFGGTNYVLQLTSTTVGRAHTNYVVILAARLENPNPSEVVLQRDWFILMDHDRDYYQPSTNGTQTPLIRLPPHGMLERELFSYTVPGDTFDGALAFLAGHQYFVLVKSRHPYRPELEDGKFITFHRRNW
jgi:hypothetical protein